MKRILIILASFYLFSCTSEDKSKTESKETKTTYNFRTLDSVYKSCLEATGLANILISQSDGQKMIDYFNLKYKKNNGAEIPTLETTYFLDSCSISELAIYLAADKTRDGVRIYYGAKSGTHQTGLFLVPTKGRPAGGGASTHESLGGIQISCTPLSNITLSGIVSADTTEFTSFYRSMITGARPNDCLTTSVWVEKCVIFILDAIIKENHEVVNGANINMAAYGKVNNPPASLAFRNQSTVVIVPSSDGLNNWDIIDEFLQKHGVPIRGFNHGELCPNSCN